MAERRTGRPVADAALDWAERGGDDPAPDALSHFPADSRALLLRLATESLETGAWTRGRPDTADQEG